MKLFKFIIVVLSFGIFSGVEAEETVADKILAISKVELKGAERSLLLVGVGLTQMMEKDYYLGAFYVDEAAQYDDAEDLVYIDAPRRMEFRFASESKVSARGFGRNLAQGIRINNSKANIDAEKEKLQQFVRLFRGSYKKGDIVRFDYQNRSEISITYNGRVIGTFEQARDLYRLLLRMWVGERPPSQSFKQGIIGQHETKEAIKLQTQFVSLK
ncbi:chalcone isomerase family protein [Aliikangiella coralliicola]|uniref:Chalcone isomerase domain-containing protein n=1 Tax=Aliikangiella coralliicola TaxID=2592383 RepID=A0A545U0G8_9GAMM|nr:chalcone isomerase family protein [Aliikangiella coralliicola]TQV82960.1 hypothetical protein FLL46_24630 [Aliikangiella coralliicola]